MSYKASFQDLDLILSTRYVSQKTHKHLEISFKVVMEYTLQTLCESLNVYSFTYLVTECKYEIDMNKEFAIYDYNLHNLF